MNFMKKDPETGKIAISGTTRTNLKKYYKDDFPYRSLSDLFNNHAPEITGKQIIPAQSVAKIIQGLGCADVQLEESLLY